MFSALNQGSTVYILEKTNNPTLRVGKVIGITHIDYNNSFNPTIDIKLKADEQDFEFKNVPSQQSIATYNNIIISETKDIMSKEVEDMLQNSKNIINSIEYHNNVIKSCEQILKDLNPRFAKEQERDQDISNLKSKIGDIESKMDKVLTLLQK